MTEHSTNRDHGQEPDDSATKQPESEPIMIVDLDELVANLAGDRDVFTLGAALSARQTQAVFDGHDDEYPVVLTYKQAADLAHVSVSTLKGWLSQGRFSKCTKRGKPGLILRNEFLRELMKDEFD